VEARNWRFTARSLLALIVPPLNAAGTAQRAVPTFVSLLTEKHSLNVRAGIIFV